ncbi:MAG: hypothetical protein PHI63_03960 [Patescibacteria group bacterium]|nr:hypothetical protein [Patescibacteria group bacterium]
MSFSPWRRTARMVLAVLPVILIGLFAIRVGYVIAQGTAPPALNFNAQVTIPGSDTNAQPFQAGKSTPVTNNLLGQYIVTVYRFGIWLAIFLAIVMTMVGGFMWTLAGGNPSRVTEAKNYIGSAMTGLVVALTSFLLLQTINPRLITIGLPDLANAELSDVGCCCFSVDYSSKAVQTCSIPACERDPAKTADQTCGSQVAGSGQKVQYYNPNYSCSSDQMLSYFARNYNQKGKTIENMEFYGLCSSDNKKPEKISLTGSDETRAYNTYCCVVTMTGGGFMWSSAFSAWWYGDQTCYDLPVRSDECCRQQASWYHPDQVAVFNDTCVSSRKLDSGLTCKRGVLPPDLSDPSCWEGVE